MTELPSQNREESIASAGLDDLVPFTFLPHLSEVEREYLEGVFEQFGGYPDLTRLWRLMDDEWDRFECDPLILDQRVDDFYRHPVWLLNGLFIEQDTESLAYRHQFVNWVSEQNPSRVADFGGGFGGLGRLLGEALPKSTIEVVDPFPHEAAQVMTASTSNVRFVDTLSGDYDILIATDVFEHVADPVGLVASTANNLRVGGHYLIANCFKPVIKCHLPQLFHLDVSWDASLRALGLIPGSKVAYGRAYRRAGALEIEQARKVEQLGKTIERWTKHLPLGRVKLGRAVTSLASKIMASD